VNANAVDTQPILLGYKGNSEIDAGFYYCPYELLISTGVVIHPQTFDPVISFMTRYGTLTVDPENYYTKIDLVDSTTTIDSI
jgi:hypothetical protein